MIGPRTKRKDLGENFMSSRQARLLNWIRERGSWIDPRSNADLNLRPYGSETPAMMNSLVERGLVCRILKPTGVTVYRALKRKLQ